MPTETKKVKSRLITWSCCGQRSSFWGWFLLIFGIVWLSSELGLLRNIPVWPLAAVLLGLYILVKKGKQE